MPAAEIEPGLCGYKLEALYCLIQPGVERRSPRRNMNLNKISSKPIFESATLYVKFYK